MLIKLKLAFEDKFRYDKAGVPRVWRPDDDIDTAFQTAKQEVLDLLPLYAKIVPQDPSLAFAMPDSDAADGHDDLEYDFSDTLNVISDTRRMTLADKFRRECDAYYVEAKRSMVSSISQIPYWMYGVIVVLGWNEFIAVLRNPLYFTLLLLAAAGTYITIQMNMVGPVTTLARGIGNEVYKVANNTLQEHFAAPAARQLEQPLRATTSSASSPRRSAPPREDIELKKLEKTE